MLFLRAKVTEKLQWLQSKGACPHSRVISSNISQWYKCSPFLKKNESNQYQNDDTFWIRGCSLLRAKWNSALFLCISLTTSSKKQSANLLSKTLGHNLEQLKFPFLWSFLCLQSHKYCRKSLVILTTVTILYGFSPVFFRTKLFAIELTPGFL